MDREDLGHEFRVLARFGPDGVLIVSVVGELDLATISELQAALDGAASSPAVAVDLVETTFVDSTALGALVARAQELERAGVPLIVAADGPAVVRTIAVTGIDRLLTVVPTLDEALDRLGTGVGAGA
jgi:anti-anti-sigma factor